MRRIAAIDLGTERQVDASSMQSGIGGADEGETTGPHARVRSNPRARSPTITPLTRGS